MKKYISIILTILTLGVFAQSNPIAINDTVEVLSQDTIAIPVLLNDYDPDGDTIIVYVLWDGYHGEAWHDDSLVYFRSEWYEGWEEMDYKAAEGDNLSNQSNRAEIQILVEHNPDVPVAKRDTFYVKYLEPTPLDIIANDFDPNGDEIIIHSITYTGHCNVEISDDSTHVIFTSDHSPYARSLFEYQLIEKNTRGLYYSNQCYVRVHLENNEDLPITVNDTVIATGGFEAEYSVLDNDINPLSDTLEIYEVTEPEHGTLTFDSQKIYYLPAISYTGSDEIEYKVRYKNKPWLYSREGKVIIHVEKNPDCPVGEIDFGEGMSFTEIAIEVISNDHDPNNNPIEVFDIKQVNFINGDVSFSSDTVYYTPPASVHGDDRIYYRIRKANDHNYYSEWIPIFLSIDHNPEFILTQPDSILTYGGIEASVNFARNDFFPDSIVFWNVMIFHSQLGEIINRTDSTFTYVPHKTSFGIDTVTYYYMNFSHPAKVLGSGQVYVDIINNLSYDSLNINNINAGFDSDLGLFSKHSGGNWNPHFEVPKDSKKHTIFLNDLWLAGINQDSIVQAAGARYYYRDFQAGPISNNYDSAFLVNWQRIWKLTKSEVHYHINNWWKENYEAIEAISSWPGNGDPGYGMPEQMGSYQDRNGDGIYDPMQGDYPLIRGDQCIFFMANEDKTHDETGGDPLGIEIHCMAYAYDSPEDSLLFNTIFIHYDFINRSENTYYDTYIGTFTDFKIGYDWDDYIGSHVMGNSFFGYNGYNIDGGYDPQYYSEHPPAQSVTVLGGPFLDSNGTDDPLGGCDYSTNGINFGNGIIDDERYGLSYFLYINDGPGVISHPHFDEEYHARLKGYWWLDVPVTFGGWGTSFLNPDATRCRYMYPGNTDPSNWGTDCELPNGGYNQNGNWWTEEGEGNHPDYRSGMGSSGPFTFYPGDIQEMDMAYVFANSYHNGDSSKKLLIERLYELRQRTLDGEIIIPNNELIVNEVSADKPTLYIYPNPAGEQLNIKYHGDDATYSIVNTLGMVVLSGKIESGSTNSINIKSLKPGIYILSISTDKNVISNKFIKL